VRRKTAQPRPEKPKARANEPNPPRVTLLEFESDEVANDEADDDEPLKKPYRERPPPPPAEELRVEHAVPVCGRAGAAIPGEVGSQLSRGISA
jgi:hypothetical protein